MIFKTYVQQVAEEFLRASIKQYPRTLEVLLSHPKLPDWYHAIAEELTKEEAIASLESRPFNPDNSIRHWAAGYVQHCLEPNKDKYLKQNRKEIVT